MEAPQRWNVSQQGDEEEQTGAVPWRARYTVHLLSIPQPMETGRRVCNVVRVLDLEAIAVESKKRDERERV